MSLFGAATSGVDPQTGSYLSKEQRVAMFRASQGRGNAGGTGSGPNKKASVQASSAIVVANKMTSVVQTLQNFSQQNVENVSQQVQQNKQNLEDLYNNVAATRAAEAKEQKYLTAQKREDRESWLRKAKENLVEGISGAVAGAANAARAAGSAAMQPMMSLWDKIKQALLLLGAAWTIDNLPAIIDAIQDFDLSEFANTLVEKVTSMRGVWSILDDVLRGVKSAIGRIARAAWRLGSFIVRKTFSITRRVVSAITDFVVGVTRRIVTKLTSIVADAAKSLGDAVKPTLQKGAEIIDDVTRPARNWLAESPVGKMFTAARDWTVDSGKKILNKGGELLQSAKTTVSGGLAKLQEGTTGIKPQSDAVRANWLSKALAPIGDAFPHLKNALKGVTGVVKRVMSIVPGLGFAIDLALNKGVAGQDWTEAIIRAAGSSILGGMSAAAGAKVGGAAGATVGAAFAGVGAIPGAAVGAALGAILAGIVGGAAGDQIGAATYEFTTGEKRTENKPLGSGVVESVTGQAPDASLGAHTEVEPKNFDYKISSGAMPTSATTAGGDLGLYTPEMASLDPEINFVEMPPIMSQVSTGGDEQSPSKEVTQVQEFFSADPEMQSYRDLAAQIYQIGA